MSAVVRRSPARSPATDSAAAAEYGDRGDLVGELAALEQSAAPSSASSSRRSAPALGRPPLKTMSAVEGWIRIAAGAESAARRVAAGAGRRRAPRRERGDIAEPAHAATRRRDVRCAARSPAQLEALAGLQRLDVEVRVELLQPLDGDPGRRARSPTACRRLHDVGAPCRALRRGGLALVVVARRALRRRGTVVGVVVAAIALRAIP